jgi:hypothetical protein
MECRALESLQVRQCLMKHFGGQVFSLGAVAHPAHYVGIDPFEIDFVGSGKAGGILLRSLMRSRSSASFFRAFNEFSAVWSYLR